MRRRNNNFFGLARASIATPIDDFCFEAKTISITPEKGSEPHMPKISDNPISMLNSLPKGELRFNWGLKVGYWLAYPSTICIGLRAYCHAHVW
jgi:hypothetical protein